MSGRVPRLSPLLTRTLVRGGRWALAAWDGDRSPRYLRRAIKELDAPREIWQPRQAARLHQFLAHAYQTSMWWRDTMKAAGVDPLEDGDPYAMLSALPVLDRATVVAHASDLASEAFNPRQVTWADTGGTTGASASFVQSLEDGARKDALAAAMRRRMGWSQDARRVYLWGAVQDLPAEPTNGLQRCKRWIRQKLQRQLVLPANDLSVERMDAYIEQLAVFRPEWMQGYPHATDLLARRVAETGRRVRIPNITLTAEPTTPDQRSRIRDAFEAHVSTWYGAREHGWIAAECRTEQKLHVNHSGVVLETDDSGAILVTDLLSHAMPLIRYALGDCAVLGRKPCPCGDPRPTIERLEGRSTDVLVLPSGRLVPGVLTSMRGLQHFVPGILENQVVQRDRRSVDVYFVAGANFEPDHERLLADDIRTTTFGELEVRTHRVDSLRREPNGKLRYCVSHIARDARPAVAALREARS